MDEAIDVGYPYGSIIYKGLQERSFSDIIITANVVDYKQNSQFLIAEQQVDIHLLEKWINDRIKNFIETKGYNGSQSGLEFYNTLLSDSLLFKYDTSASSINFLTNIVLRSPLIQKINQNSINYWIIQKSNDSLIGPFTKAEYVAQRKALGVPESLDLH